MIEDKIKKSIFYLLIETTKPFDSKAFIEFYEIDLTKNFKKNLKPTQSINLEIYTFDNENLLENATVTSVNSHNYLSIYFGSILTYIDLYSNEIVFKIDFSERILNVEFFLSPTNLFSNKLRNLISMENTHNLIALNNLNDLILIKLEKGKSYKIIKSSLRNKSEMKFESFKINKMQLIAFCKTNSKLYGFDLEQVLTQNSFEKFKFQIQVINLSSYGFSIDSCHFYTIENKKNLKFYEYSGAKKTDEIALYYEPQLIACSRDFLTIAIKDKRVISYLIMDKENLKESYEKVNRLEIR